MSEQTINTDDKNQMIVIQTIDKTQVETSPSIKPSIVESERFIQFLNNRFSLGLKDDLIILIHETSPKVKGYFRSVKCQKIWKAEKENPAFKQQQNALNSIVLSSHTLKSEPYETLAHELAHYVNFKNGVKDCSSSQYHNKHFKAQAEKLLLKVEKLDNSHGYAFTSMTDEFILMLNEEFKPMKDAFKIFQEIGEPKDKKPSRMLKFMCGCGCIIRTAKNEDKPLIAICQYCNTEFKRVER